jgi:hypothetical protein
MKRADPNPLQPLLEKLEQLLIEEIPKAVKRAAFNERTYCLRIAYFGSDSEGDREPVLTLVRENARIKAIGEHGRQAPHYIWCADEVESPQQSYDVPFENAELTSLCRQMYKILDRKGLGPLRHSLERVSTEMNKLDWQQLTNATDDFVVFPADWSHDLGDFDHMGCIPEEKLELLRSRNFLGRAVPYELDG